MNALTVNGKQLTLGNTQVSLNYVNPTCVFFQSQSILPAGTYKFIVNIPGAIEVKCVNLPTIGSDTVLPIVNGVAKLVLTSDVNIWNASIWPMYALDSNHYEMYEVYNSSSFELIRVNFGEILGYEEQQYTRFMWRWDGLVTPGVFQMGAIRLNSIDLPYTYVTYGKGGGNAIAAQLPEKMVAAITGQDANHKWCVNNWYNNLWGWLIFDMPSAIVPTKYELQIAGDTNENPGRNPTRTRLYASTGTPTTFEDASWELIADSSETLPTTNYAWTTVWSK